MIRKSLFTFLIVSFQSFSNQVICNNSSPHFPKVEKQSKEAFRISKIYSDKTCEINKKCPNGDNPRWGIQKVGADLAEKIVQKELQKVPAHKKDHMVASVGILDTGFNIESHRNMISSEKFKIKKGIDEAGPPGVDEFGHGTGVTSALAAKEIGVTSANQLTFYRISKKDAGASSNEEDLESAIIRACKENDIINLSWGNILEERGGRDLLKKRWYDTARKHGCLVVESAGNSGIKEKLEEDVKTKLEDPHLLVASTNHYSKESKFSTIGDIHAPGQGLYTLVSKNSSIEKMYENIDCKVGGHRVAPINGTSYASPIVAGVASQIVTLLKLNDSLPKDPQRKISLIKGILMASTSFSGGKETSEINALAAVHIAKGIKHQNFTLSEDYLIEIGKKEARSRCQKERPKCLQEITCEGLKSCSNELRFRVLLCDDLGSTEDLFEIYKSQKENHLALDTLSKREDGEEITDSMMEFYQTVWEKTFGSSDKDNLEHRLNLTAQALNSPLSWAEKFKKITESNEFYSAGFALSQNYKNLKNIPLVNKFKNIFTNLPHLEKINFIAELSPKNPNAKKDLYILHFLYSQIDSFPQDVQNAIKNKIKAFGKSWVSGELKIGHSYYVQKASIFNIFMDEIENVDEIISESLNKGVDKNNFHLYQTAFMFHKRFSDKKMIPWARSLLSTGDLEKQNFPISTLDTTGSYLFYLSKNHKDQSLVKDYLLKLAPKSKLPKVLTMKGAKFKDTFISDENFLGPFINSNITAQKVDHKTFSHNIVKGFFNSQNISLETKKKVLNENLENFKTLLRNSANILSNSTNTTDKISAQNVLMSLIAHQRSFYELTDQDIISTELKTLRENMKKNPEKYPLHLRSSMNKVFGYF